jgi:hypothetical protein
MQRRTKGQTVVNAKTGKWTDSGQCKDGQKDRQWSMQRRANGQTVVNVKDKRTNNDTQNITQKTNDRTVRIPLKTGVKSNALEELVVSAPHVTPVVLLLNNTNVI